MVNPTKRMHNFNNLLTENKQRKTLKEIKKLLFYVLWFPFGTPKGSEAQNEENILPACLNKKIERLLKITQSFVLRVKTVLTPTQAIKILKQ